MRVRIVYVPTADLRGPDLARIGTVEDIDPEIARVMLHEGSVVAADEESAVVVEAAQPHTMPAQPVVGVPVLDADQLAALTKAELVDYAGTVQVELPTGATKAEMVDALAPPTEPTA